jgi:asparagine synthase (glutamine-hydrolysing)
MCGILGFSGEFSRSSLERGLDCIAHRGPDDSGLFFDLGAGIGLGHRRLSILELSPLGHQPMVGNAGVTIIFNGEIYNFRELRRDLESRGYTFRGQSDTEVILAMYLEHGQRMLPMLNGIFALAIWDPRSHTTLIARDALGVKPLYIAELPRGVAYGSEIKGLLHLAPQSRELDTAALRRYLTFLWCPGEGTPLKGVRKLDPGTAITLLDGRIVFEDRWYRLPAVRGVEQIVEADTAPQGTLQALRAAVHRQLVADVPVGAFLSGGLDSSAIVALAREQSPGIRCFTIDTGGGLNPGDADDLPYAQRVAKHLQVPIDVIRVDPSRMAGELERMVVQLDEPLADFAALNVLHICKLARDQGMKVLLSGAGGDDLFSGYRRHLAVSQQHWWSWLPAGTRRALERASGRLDQRRGLSRRITRLFHGAGLDGDERLASYFQWGPPSRIDNLFVADIRREFANTHASDPLGSFLHGLPQSVGPLDRMLALEQRFFLSDHNLPYTDKMSMAVGVEVRVPFLDLDLVDYAARIPSAIKQRGRIGKWPLKRAMEPYLPHDVIYRPKVGFGVPLRQWVRREFRPMIDDLLSPNSLQRRGLFDQAAVGRLIAANQEGRIDASYTILSLLCIEIWCRSFLDRLAFPSEP